MTYIFIVLLGLTLILQCIFSNFMKKKYNITSSEFREMKSKVLGMSVCFFITLLIVIYVVFKFEYNIISIALSLIVIVFEFIYELKKLTKLNEKKYTIYYIGESVIWILFIILLIINIYFK